MLITTSSLANDNNHFLLVVVYGFLAAGNTVLMLGNMQDSLAVSRSTCIVENRINMYTAVALQRTEFPN